MAHAQKLIFRRNGRVYFNRRWRQFGRLLAAEMCASAVVMLDTPCSEVVWRILAIHSIRQFPLHFPSRASPCAIKFQLDSNNLSFISFRTPGWVSLDSFPYESCKTLWLVSGQKTRSWLFCSCRKTSWEIPERTCHLDCSMPVLFCILCGRKFYRTKWIYLSCYS
jgi:hypothetical protein